jgi:hypothetical protein
MDVILIFGLRFWGWFGFCGSLFSLYIYNFKKIPSSLANLGLILGVAYFGGF